MGKNIKRGQPGNPGQFAPSRTGMTAPTAQPVTAPTSSPENASPNYDQQYAQLHSPADRTPATKQEVAAIVQPIAGEKFRVAPEGAVNRRPTTARLRMGMGTRSTYTTKLERNGRYMVTIWGRNAEGKTEQAAAAYRDAGYTIDDQGGDWLIVHNGTVLDLEGAIRFEGQY